jgi:hypothetical protein
MTLPPARQDHLTAVIHRHGIKVRHRHQMPVDSPPAGPQNVPSRTPAPAPQAKPPGAQIGGDAPRRSQAAITQQTKYWARYRGGDAACCGKTSVSGGRAARRDLGGPGMLRALAWQPGAGVNAVIV